MYEPSRASLESWSHEVLRFALSNPATDKAAIAAEESAIAHALESSEPVTVHKTSHTENISIGYWGRHLARWLHEQWGDTLAPYRDVDSTEYTNGVLGASSDESDSPDSSDGMDIVGAAVALRPQLEAIIWDTKKTADRQDMFAGQDVFNWGDYIWMVSILNSVEPIEIFTTSAPLDTLCKAVFLHVAFGVWDNEDTNLLSERLSHDMEARGHSSTGFDDRAGYDSFKLLFYFYKQYDEMQQTIDDKVPFSWLLASWRKLHEAKA